MADTKSIGQATAEGFARTQNQPIPQLRHDPFAGGSVPVIDAETTWPVRADVIGENSPFTRSGESHPTETPQPSGVPSTHPRLAQE